MIADDKNAVRLIDRVNDAVRENPIAAGLIGVGLFMTFFGNAKLPALAGKLPGAVKSAAGAVGDTVASGGRAVSGGLSAAGGAVADAASNLSEKASTAVKEKLGAENLAEHGNWAGEAITRGTEQLRDNAASAARRGMDAGIALQGKLADTLARQPLLLGAIGLAVGAGMASALPATDTERELVGEQASALRGEVQDRANQVISDVKDAAAAQGFTTTAAKDALQEIARKTQSVAGAARSSVGSRSRFS
jgi:hypothetical protein